jgi:alkylation response protein AidB-like acyl-CoA dehydrogenase
MAEALRPGVQQVIDPAGTSLASEVSAALAAARLANLAKSHAGEYETVAASQTAQVLGATGAAGDYLRRLIIIPATLSPGAVALLDNATSINILPGGASSLTELKPIVVDIDAISVSGAWKITTGANVSVIAIGDFT